MAAAELQKLEDACLERFPASKGGKKMGAGGVRFPKCLTFLGKSYVTDSRKYHSNQRPSTRPPVRGVNPDYFFVFPFWNDARRGFDTAYPPTHPSFFPVSLLYKAAAKECVKENKQLRVR